MGFQHQVRILVLASATALASCSTLKPPATQALLADDYSLVEAYMQKYIPSAMKRSRITGLSVALIDDQRIVWSQGFGFADKEQSVAATADTLYRAGSVSKLYTAIAVMQQVEAGRVSLDEPLRRAVPEFALRSRFGSIDAITLRNTLSHHAGIPGAYLDGMYAREPESFKTVASRLADHYAAYAPDTVFAYSNAGYSLAGHAVENLSGLPFVEYMEANVLAPLSMQDSNFSMDVSDDRVSKSYWNGQAVDELSIRDLPAGGLISHVRDLAQLVRRLHAKGDDDRTVLSRVSLEQMMAHQEYDSPFELTHFNGIGFLQYPGVLNKQFQVVGHGGQTMAHSALLMSVPELQLGVVLLANSPDKDGVLGKISDELLRVAYPVKTGRALSGHEPETNAGASRESLPGVQTSFDGVYASPFGVVTISGAAPRYRVSALGQAFSLRPAKPAKNDTAAGYNLKFKLFGFIPITDRDVGKTRFYARNVDDSKLIVMDSGTQAMVVATQVIEGPRNAAWDARIGRYEITNPIKTDLESFKVSDVELGRDEGYYFIDDLIGNGQSRVALEVISDTEVITQGTGRGFGETLLARDDGTINYLGLVFRKVN